ncbi:hypothetical protein ABPG75_005344 [Micractinium tetrahymenae]
MLCAAALWTLAALLSALLVYGFHPLKRWRFRRFLGPRPAWLLGNIREVRALGLETALQKWGRQYGPVFVCWLGGVPHVVTEDPDLARKVLVLAGRNRFPNLLLGMDEAHVGHSLFFASGEQWKVARNAWQSLNNLCGLMAACAERLLSALDRVAGSGQPTDIRKQAGRSCALQVNFDTLAAGAQGQDSRKHVQATTADSLVAHVNEIFTSMGNVAAWSALLLLFPELERVVKWLANLLPDGRFRRELVARRQLRGLTHELIQNTREAQQAEGSDNAGASATLDNAALPASSQRRSRAAPGSFLALLTPVSDGGKAVDGGRLDDLWVSAQASTFIGAGYETTANVLSYAVYLLASNPEKEAKLLAEIDAHERSRSGDGGGALLPEAGWGEPGQAQPFPYAAAESLRLFPPVPAIGRQPKGPGMRLGGYDIPADATLLVSVFGMHRSERLWRDATDFRPERFLPGNDAEAPPGAFVPFGDGARRCIGYRFALTEATLVLTRVYQQFTFRLLPGAAPLKLQTGLTMSPAGGIPVTVHRRAAAGQE